MIHLQIYFSVKRMEETFFCFYDFACQNLKFQVWDHNFYNDKNPSSLPLFEFEHFTVGEVERGVKPLVLKYS